MSSFSLLFHYLRLTCLTFTEKETISVNGTERIVLYTTKQLKHYIILSQYELVSQYVRIFLQRKFQLPYNSLHRKV